MIFYPNGITDKSINWIIGLIVYTVGSLIIYYLIGLLLEIIFKATQSFYRTYFLPKGRENRARET